MPSCKLASPRLNGIQKLFRLRSVSRKDLNNPPTAVGGIYGAGGDLCREDLNNPPTARGWDYDFLWKAQSPYTGYCVSINVSCVKEEIVPCLCRVTTKGWLRIKGEDELFKGSS